MIRYIKGTLALIEDAAVVVDNQGIGYRILVPVSLLETLPPLGGEVIFYTYLNVREDAMQLFGFASLDDLEVFQKLITVSGVGPKAGLGILGTLSADDVRFAVLSDDAATISKAPGIGIKTAKKLIVELKDKLDIREVVEGIQGEGFSGKEQENALHREAVSEAVEALTALGYSATDAMKAVRQVDGGAGMSTEELLRQALKGM